MMSKLIACLEDRSGATIPLVAIFITLLMTLMAVSANLSLAYMDKRNYQSHLDLAALSLMRAKTASVTSAEDVLQRKGMSVEDNMLTVTTGWYEADASLPIEERFTPRELNWNAVRLEMDVPIRERVLGDMLQNDNSFSIASTAVHRQTVDVWAGSRLLRLEGGLTGLLLQALVGYDGRITVADYESLVGVELELLGFLEQLAISADLDAATYEDVLESDVTIGQLAVAIDAVTGRKLAGLGIDLPRATTGLTVRLMDVISLGEIGALGLDVRPNSGDLGISAGELLMSSLSLANGERQLDLDVSALFDLTQVSLDLGDKGALMSWNFDQARDEPMKTSQLQLLVKPLDELLTVRLALAEAETRIKDAKCDKTRNPSYVDIGLTTSAAELELMLGRTRLLTLDLSDESDQTLRFSASDIRNGVVKTGRSGLSVDINRAPLLYRPLVKLVDDLLIALGLNLGEVDVRVDDVNCSRPYLVR